MKIRFCTDPDQRIGSLDELRNDKFFSGIDWEHIRDRPAAYQPIVKAIDDTSNFDEFPDVKLKIRTFYEIHRSSSRKKYLILATSNKEEENQSLDWPFTGYTYKIPFNGLTIKPRSKTSLPL